ncbi:MAG TPA: bifunctional diaminohydroxyphosphoribosylaminopyrimidine deaminase/5-amino-6-(5-phosphoribosylamino)uracil reductase RibD [Armatimonadota bacterium]
MPITPEDLRYLRRALRLARRALGATSPNPLVGAVVVRDGLVVGEGYHARAGEPHAEIHALRAAGEQARGATLYLTLEPCSHYGKTPPCADTVVKSGVRRVVFSSLDPNPLVAGAGLAKLRAAGLDVDYGALAAQEEQLNEAWRHWIATRRPFVLVKLAASLDGKIATRTGESQWITGEAARRDVHRLRATQDAILTTATTVLADDPQLTARLPGARHPRRIILDAALRTSPEARVYAPAAPPPLLVTAVQEAARLTPFLARGVEVLTLPAAPGGIDLPALMTALGEREILSLLVEAGGRFADALLQARLVQKFRLYLAPLLIGGRDAPPLLCGEGVARLAEAPRLAEVAWKRIGEDFRIEGRIIQQ